MPKMFAGLDVSDKTTSICIVNVHGEVVLETSTSTDASSIGTVLKPYRRMLEKVGHESCASATWLHKELVRKKWPVICLDALHVHAALAANRNKTDKNDARGIAEVLGRGMYTTAYVRSEASQIGRMILTHRKAVLRKKIDLERLASSNLKLFGARLIRQDGNLVPKSAPRHPLDFRVLDVVDGTVKLIEQLQTEADRLDQVVSQLAKKDPICKRFMAVPGIGPITAFSYRTAIDDPLRFKSSRTVAAHFGLTPRTYQSGESSYVGHITKRGDSEVRSLLYQSAGSIINISKSPWRVRLWAKRLAKEKGFKVAAIACARKLAVILHKMWLTNSEFDPGV